MREQEIQVVLAAVSQPREPRPEFRRELRDRLLTRGLAPRVEASRAGPELAVLDDLPTVTPLPRPRRSRRLLVAGVAAALALVIGWTAVTVTSGEDDGAVRTTVPKLTVQQACRTFNTRAFSEIPRAELLDAPKNAILNHPDPPRVLHNVVRSLTAFRADLERAGLHDDAVLNSLQIAISQAQRGADLAEQGALTRVLTLLQDIEPRLVEVQRGLTRLGVPTCL